MVAGFRQTRSSRVILCNLRKSFQSLIPRCSKEKTIGTEPASLASISMALLREYGDSGDPAIEISIDTQAIHVNLTPDSNNKFPAILT